MSKDIFVALPAYSGEIGVQTFHSLLMAMEESRALGWTFKAENINCRMGDADLSLARNAFLGKFLSTDCTDLVFVDADISWHQGEFVRLVGHDVDFVAGCYRAKTDAVEKYPVIWPAQKRMWNDPATGYPLLEAAAVAGGFWRIRRDGLERVIEKLKPRMFCDDTAPGVPCPWLFEFAFDGEFRFSEDYVFCKRWRESGEAVWVDPCLNVDHTGKKTYSGELLEHLRRQTSVADAA